jgi:PAS domain S-box-containing protein
VSARKIPRIARVLCLSGAAIGALGLGCWLVGAEELTAVFPDQPAMMPNTALGLVLLGGAAALRHREAVGRVRTVASLAAAVIGLVIGAGTLAEYAFAIDLGLDRLLFDAGAGPHPGRPSPPTALAFVLLASALLVFDLRPRARARPSEWLVLAAGIIALAALAGLVLGAGPLYRLARAPVIGVALPTAIGVLVISAGMLLARPRGGIMRLATSRRTGGILLRRLALPAIVVPIALGIVVTRLTRHLEITEQATVIGILASAAAVVGLALVAVAAAPLNRAHAELETSRERTQALFDQAPDGIFVADLDGRYVDVNAAGARLLGRTRDEIVGMTIVDLLPAEDVERLLASKAEMLAGRTHVAEWTLRAADGRWIPVEVSAGILPDGRWQGFVRDITERKRLEAALRLAEARSSGILAIAPDAIVSIDEEQRITAFNAAAERIFGYPAAEALGRPLDLLVPERLRTAHRAHVATFAASDVVSRRMGERGDVTVYGRRRSGEEFAAEAGISQLEVGGRKVLTAALRDVSAQRRIEREQRFLAEVGPILAETLDYEETLTRIADVAVKEIADLCIVDLVEEGGVRRRLKVASRDPAKAWVCDALGGISVDGERPYMLRAVFETRRPLLLARPDPGTIDAMAQAPEHLRALRAAEVRSLVAAPLVARGELIGAIGFVSSDPARTYGPDDVRLAEELGHRAALSIENAILYGSALRATRARDDILGVVAHDLRNPLSSVLAQAELMLRRAPATADDRARRAAESIQRAATRMARLIEDLLDVTRLEAGRLSIEAARLPAAEVAGEAVEAQRATAAAAGLDLRLDLAPRLPELWADRDRLLQLFENLVGNAVKFTPAGGTVIVGAAPRDREVLFWVADTGRGIPAGDLAKVFDRFWQAREGTRHGAGLGLPIAKGIVEAHGGRIWVESTVDRGTTFFFTIPAAPGREDQLASRPASGP